MANSITKETDGIDGHIGSKTFAAIESFQTKYFVACGSIVDGKVGPKTHAEFINIWGV